MRYVGVLIFVAIALALAIGRQASPRAEEDGVSVIAEVASSKPVSGLPSPRRPEPPARPAKVVEVQPAPSSSVELAAFLEKTFVGLPRRDRVREMSPEEIHHTPKALLDAGAALGEIAARLKSDPAAVAQGIGFYERCAGDEAILTSVRAVCLRNLKRWQPGTDLSKYPEYLRGIADRLPPSQ